MRLSWSCSISRLMPARFASAIRLAPLATATSISPRARPAATVNSGIAAVPREIDGLVAYGQVFGAQHQVYGIGRTYIEQITTKRGGRPQLLVAPAKEPSM